MNIVFGMCVSNSWFDFIKKLWYVVGIVVLKDFWLVGIGEDCDVY